MMLVFVPVKNGTLVRCVNVEWLVKRKYKNDADMHIPKETKVIRVGHRKNENDAESQWRCDCGM